MGRKILGGTLKILEYYICHKKDEKKIKTIHIDIQEGTYQKKIKDLLNSKQQKKSLIYLTIGKKAYVQATPPALPTIAAF